MLLDLREIIGVPGGEVSFDYEINLSDAAIGSVKEIKSPSRAAGSVKNRAGVLNFTANVDATLVCVCARCLSEFAVPVQRAFSAVLTVEEENGEIPGLYGLDGDKADADEIIVSEFVLAVDQRYLCSEECKGICQKCGADLNAGRCSCESEIDPRLAVLGQLLE